MNMKKSEMVTLIANELLDKHYIPKHQTHDTAVYCLEKAEELLAAMVKAGMQPPAYTKKFKKGSPGEYYYPHGMPDVGWENEEE